MSLHHNTMEFQQTIWLGFKISYLHLILNFKV